MKPAYYKAEQPAVIHIATDKLTISKNDLLTKTIIEASKAELVSFITNDLISARDSV